ncbi:biotin transporter BioY [Brochothrix thermosphacta]|uniref:biotin transporter BioY n=1 Tax=Brochothrix thermosphacta TaxID=2756 RepID=UPI000D7B30AE|nr:biotin transporter BioY [Brochothrix thermosphacta]SPN75866.1 putative biotin transporter BioY [Brochothrix thermosphacta]
MKTHSIAFIGIMIAVLIILGFIPPITIGIIPVPIAVQSMGVLLAGLLLGKRNGTIAVLLLLLLVAVGLPVLAGGRGGFALFYSPTAGYIIAYPIAAFLIGWWSGKLGEKPSFFRLFAVTVIAGVLVIDSFGAIGLHFVTGMPLKAAFLSNLVFIPGDLLKAILSVIILQRLPKNLRYKLRA